MSLSYTIRKIDDNPKINNQSENFPWHVASSLKIDYFHEESSDHHPQTEVKLLYSENQIYIIFKVTDNYVRCIHTNYMDMVCEDSCVEWFVQPKSGKGYFNFEINCGGTLHCCYIEDHRRTETGFEKSISIPKTLAKTIDIYHSLTGPINPEIQRQTEWVIEYKVPISFFKHYLGPLSIRSGDVWRANFYKCGDKTSHPHWASWSPVSALNFHQPNDFGILVFA